MAVPSNPRFLLELKESVQDIIVQEPNKFEGWVSNTALGAAGGSRRKSWVLFQ